MTSEWTTKKVRRLVTESLTISDRQSAAEDFDRWLAAHDAKVKAEALREAALDVFAMCMHVDGVTCCIECRETSDSLSAREALIEAMAEAGYLESVKLRKDQAIRVEPWGSLPEYWRRIYRSQARAAAEMLAKAITDEVRGLHVPHECRQTWDSDCFIVHGGGCTQVGSCAACSYPHPCPTVRLLDEIDAALGVERA